MEKRFKVGDTVFVAAPTFHQGEGGVVIEMEPAWKTIYVVRFSDGSEDAFFEDQLTDTPTRFAVGDLVRYNPSLRYQQTAGETGVITKIEDDKLIIELWDKRPLTGIVAVKEAPNLLDKVAVTRWLKKQTVVRFKHWADLPHFAEEVYDPPSRESVPVDTYGVIVAVEAARYGVRLAENGQVVALPAVDWMKVVAEVDQVDWDRVAALLGELQVALEDAMWLVRVHFLAQGQEPEKYVVARGMLWKGLRIYQQLAEEQRR